MVIIILGFYHNFHTIAAGICGEPPAFTCTFVRAGFGVCCRVISGVNVVPVVSWFGDEHLVNCCSLAPYMFELAQISLGADHETTESFSRLVVKFKL